MSKHRSDRGLEMLARSFGNDPRDLEALWDRYGQTVFAYLVATLRDRTEAEDVHQQVFEEAWKRRADYDPSRAGLFTWLMTIARSRAIDSLRRRRPEPVGNPSEQEGGPAAPGPEDETIERWRVAHLLRQIPHEEAALLRMRFQEDLTQRQIAERSGLPLGTVKMRMVQALERLRGMMEGDEDR